MLRECLGHLTANITADRKKLSEQESHENCSYLFLTHSEIKGDIVMEERWTDLNQRVIELMGQGRFQDAVVAGQVALDKALGEYGENHESVAISLNNLGELYSVSGDLEKAEKALVQAAKISEVVHGPLAYDVAETLSSLVNVLIAQNKNVDAKPFLQKAVEIYEQSPEDAAEQLPTAYNLLAGIYLEQGEDDAAKQQLNKALVFLEKQNGRSETKLKCVVLETLAELDKKADRLEDAEKKLRRAMTLYEDLLGPVNPSIARILLQLGTLYQLKGSIEVGIKLTEQATELLKNTLPAGDEEICGALSQLGRMHVIVGQLEKAEHYYRETIKLFGKGKHKGNMTLADVQNSLAEVHILKEEYTKALPLIQSSYDSRRKVLGSRHPAVAQSLNNYGLLLSRQGQFAKAMKKYQTSLNIRETAFGENHPALIESLENIAEVYNAEGHFENAEQFLRRALMIWQHSGEFVHPGVAKTQYHLGMVLMVEGKHDESEMFLLQAKDNLEKSGPQVQMLLLSVYRGISMLYRKIDRIGESEEYAAKVRQGIQGGASDSILPTLH
jgi:tetratricopeptide (TPR) repeat protein